MFEKFGDTARAVLVEAYEVSLEFKSEETGTDHLLLALCQEQAGLPFRAFAAMNLRSETLRQELERQLLASASPDIVPVRSVGAFSHLDKIPYTHELRAVVKRASQFRLFFGHDKVEPEHLLLAALDLSDQKLFKLLEELGLNTTYLYRLVVGMLATVDAQKPELPGLRKTTISGLTEIIAEKITVIEDLEQLSCAINAKLAHLPQRPEIAHVVFVTFLPDFLYTQVAYQRYLLEETLVLLRKRTGTLDPEFAASIVSATAQTIRSEARAGIEYFWTNEFRSLSKLPDEADYDLIGSVIEDLWWTHSEELALTEVFDEALDDHRRKRMLDLQKRRVEISQRFSKLRTRLQDTIRQCFTKLPRSMSA